MKWNEIQKDIKQKKIDPEASNVIFEGRDLNILVFLNP